MSTTVTELPAGAREEAACPMCGSADRVPVFRFGPFGVVRCAACSLQYLSPRLVEAAMLELYRSGDYYEGGAVGYQSYGGQEAALRATFGRVVRSLVAAGFGGGDLLEIGCGYGFFLDAATTAFRSRTGTEFSAEPAASARARGHDVVVGGVDDLPPDARFDCIFSGHVIEHVYQPHAFVERLHELLRPGGVLVLGTPDGGSPWRRSMGSRWPSFKVPEHVTYFDRRSLDRLLDDAGFEDVRPFPYRHAFPLGLVLDRLKLARLGRRLGRLDDVPIWLPATTVAASGRRSRAPAGDRAAGSAR